MKNIRKKVIVFIIICSICLITLISIIINKNVNSTFSPVLQTDIKTIEDLCAYYNIKLIEQVDSDTSDYSKQIFVEFPYDTKNENGTSSRSFYEEVIEMFAKVYNYNNIIVLDDSKAIKIEIKCYKTSQLIDNYTINGEKNYFENLETKLNLSKMSNIELKDIKVESEILKKLINNSWNENAVNFGSKDSELDNYEIYFDEGIEVRKINGKVFNIVFTQKYTENIIESINTNTSLEEIVKKYGESTFTDLGDLIGYKTKDFYIFFNSEQISVYRIDTYNTDEFANLVTNFINSKDERKFVDELKRVWPDYDEYTENESRGNIILKYSLKGVEFNINITREHGVLLYNNFNGKVTNDVNFEQILKQEKDMPNYTYVKNEDLVVKNETKRNYSIHNFKFNLENYEYEYEDSKSKDLISNSNTEENDFARPSNKFFCIKENNNLMIFSKNNEHPPFEIKNNYCFLWIDDTHLVYSISQKGIYIYDAITRNIKTVKEGNENFKINGYDEDGDLDYDDEIIRCSID